MGHHHLPPALKTVEGCAVGIDIDRDALHPDGFGSLTTTALRGVGEFPLHGRPAFTLGHEDMLLHLCRHLSQRAERLRLVWVADVLG